MTATRVCTRCGKLRPLDDFHGNGLTPSGLKRYKTRCKDCMALEYEERLEMPWGTSEEVEILRGFVHLSSLKTYLKNMPMRGARDGWGAIEPDKLRGWLILEIERRERVAARHPDCTVRWHQKGRIA